MKLCRTAVVSIRVTEAEDTHRLQFMVAAAEDAWAVGAVLVSLETMLTDPDSIVSFKMDGLETGPDLTA